jgi:dUTP pyrophosphatase
MRRFAPVAAYETRQIPLPQRKTARSAGYDLAAAERTVIRPGQVALVPTGLKAYMPPGEVLVLTVRSSLAARRRLMLANGVGIIDADYVDNPENEGHILVALYNASGEEAVIEEGERLAQGIFLRFETVDGDSAGGARGGGFGSTGVR